MSPFAGFVSFTALSCRPLSGPPSLHLSSRGFSGRAHERPTDRKDTAALRAAALLCLQPRPACCVHPKYCHTSSIAALIVGSFHARLPARAFVYTLSILCLRLSTLARLSCSHSVLIPLGFPGGTCVRVIPAGLLSVIANGTASRGGRALRECVRRKHDACQQCKNSHGDLRM
jgi:hypothetical protein